MEPRLPPRSRLPPDSRLHPRSRLPPVRSPWPTAMSHGRLDWPLAPGCRYEAKFPDIKLDPKTAVQSKIIQSIGTKLLMQTQYVMSQQRWVQARLAGLGVHLTLPRHPSPLPSHYPFILASYPPPTPTPLPQPLTLTLRLPNPASPLCCMQLRSQHRPHAEEPSSQLIPEPSSHNSAPSPCPPALLPSLHRLR